MTTNTESKNISISEVLEMQPGNEDNPHWLNEVRGTVAYIEPKKTREGKAFWQCTIADETNANASLQMAVWSKPDFVVNDVIEITGSGARLTEYKGDLQIALGKKSEVHILRSAKRAPTGAPSDNGAVPEPPSRPGDVSEFERTMKRMALFYCHAMKYAAQIDERIPFVTPEQQQACVSTLFIEGCKRGLVDIVPALDAAEKPKAATPAPAAPPPKPAPKQETFDEDVPF